MFEQKSHHCSSQKKSLGSTIVSRTWKLMIAALAVALCLLPGLHAAQEETGEITGTVRLKDGSELPGILIEVTGAPLEKKKITVSNHQGVYKLPALPQGSYQLVFKLEGIKTVKRKNILVRAGVTVTLDTFMEWGEIKEVIYDGRAPTIEVRRSVKSTKKTNEVSKKPLAGKKANLEETGEIFGTVVLEDVSAIPGVLIEATIVNLVRKTVVSNEVGAFKLSGLLPGSYEVVFMLKGFKTVKRGSVHVRAGGSQKLDILMELAGPIIYEKYFCPTLIDVRKSSDSTNISKEVFKKLPRGRDFTSILAILPPTRLVR